MRSVAYDIRTGERQSGLRICHRELPEGQRVSLTFVNVSPIRIRGDVQILEQATLRLVDTAGRSISG
jgi:hypothetical protein